MAVGASSGAEGMSAADGKIPAVPRAVTNWVKLGALPTGTGWLALPERLPHFALPLGFLSAAPGPSSSQICKKEFK